MCVVLINAHHMKLLVILYVHVLRQDKRAKKKMKEASLNTAPPPLAAGKSEGVNGGGTAEEENGEKLF